MVHGKFNGKTKDGCNCIAKRMNEFIAISNKNKRKLEELYKTSSDSGSTTDKTELEKAIENCKTSAKRFAEVGQQALNKAAQIHINNEVLAVNDQMFACFTETETIASMLS